MSSPKRRTPDEPVSPLLFGSCKYASCCRYQVHACHGTHALVQQLACVIFGLCMPLHKSSDLIALACRRFQITREAPAPLNVLLVNSVQLSR